MFARVGWAAWMGWLILLFVISISIPVAARVPLVRLVTATRRVPREAMTSSRAPDASRPNQLPKCVSRSPIISVTFRKKMASKPENYGTPNLRCFRHRLSGSNPLTLAVAPALLAPGPC
jgi:hypothetical protein